MAGTDRSLPAGEGNYGFAYSPIKIPREIRRRIHPATIRQLLNAQIAMRAYEIWMEQGQPEGRDLEHWYMAVRELID